MFPSASVYFVMFFFCFPLVLLLVSIQGSCCSGGGGGEGVSFNSTGNHLVKLFLLSVL